MIINTFEDFMEPKTTVVNLKTEDFDVYIGRGSIFGNPFVIGKDGSRDEVIEKYRNHFLSNSELMEKSSELFGKKLGCFCKPKKCHEDILAEYVNSLCSSTG